MQHFFRHVVCSRRYRHWPGFTIPELLVSLTIFVVLGTVILANFRQSNYQEELQTSAQLLAGGIRKIQNLATSGQIVHFNGPDKIPNTPDDTETVPPGGYGMAISWSPTQDNPAPFYFLYGDYATWTDYDPENRDCVYIEPTSANRFYDEECDQKLDNSYVRLRPNVRISYIDPVGFTEGATGSTYLTYVDITFQAPLPVPFVEGGTEGTIRIELQHSRSGQCRLVTMNTKSGLISETLENRCLGS